MKYVSAKDLFLRQQFDFKRLILLDFRKVKNRMSNQIWITVVTKSPLLIKKKLVSSWSKKMEPSYFNDDIFSLSSD